MWTGYWVQVTGVIHTVFGLTVYSAGWRAIGKRGWWNAVDGDLTTERAFWFTIFGPLAVLLGALMVWVERRGVRLPKFLGWALLGGIGVCGVLMPVSGMWLLVPPALALLRVEREVERAASTSR